MITFNYLKKIIKISLIFFIKFYQKYISICLPPRCKYYPSCSQYMLDAINNFGIFKGVFLGTCRILRCHPFNNKCGYDPIPKMENK